MSDSRTRLARLTPHPEAVTGDLDELVHVDWTVTWRPESVSAPTRSTGSTSGDVDSPGAPRST